jgi:hypothetical protein
MRPGNTESILIFALALPLTHPVRLSSQRSPLPRGERRGRWFVIYTFFEPFGREAEESGVGIFRYLMEDEIFGLQFAIRGKSFMEGRGFCEWARKVNSQV